jgi:uncharacterized Zn-binding protein involved in type VI secretion
MHVCPMSDGPKPHVGGPVLPPCAITVHTGGIPQARIGDLCTCVGPPDVIVQGSPTVLVMGSPAARLGDATAHGGRIVIGMPTVLIGESGGGGGGSAGFPPAAIVANAAASAPCMRAAASRGSAFVSP